MNNMNKICGSESLCELTGEAKVEVWAVVDGYKCYSKSTYTIDDLERLSEDNKGKFYELGEQRFYNEHCPRNFSSEEIFSRFDKSFGLGFNDLFAEFQSQKN